MEIKLTPEAVSLLQQVKTHILEEPLRLRMSTWYVQGIGSELIFADSRWGEPNLHIMPACKTIGCIAGWVVVLKEGEEKVHGVFDIPSRAIELLGFNPKNNCEEAFWDKLFIPTYWPEEDRQAYYAADAYENPQQRRAQLVAEQIDKFCAAHAA